jgi:hypothetical protein
MEIIMLSKIRQTEKGKYHIFSHMWNLDLGGKKTNGTCVKLGTV